MPVHRHANDRDPRDSAAVGGTLTARATDSRAPRPTVSVIIPCQNEAPTVASIVSCIRSELVEAEQLVDEVIVMDDGSVDDTGRIAEAAGAKVVAVDSVLPHLEAGSGKGNVLWKSLFASYGDVICWVDGDIRNFEAHFVRNLIQPLLEDPTLCFVKAYYQRPYENLPQGGGRVTELVARPMISRYFPELSGIRQPLSGEYAGRRSALESVPFVEGWGVEMGLLIDLTRQFGVESIAQADLGIRRHRNRALHELTPQAAAIINVMLKRSGCDANGQSEKVVRLLPDGGLEWVPVENRERPPAGVVRRSLRSEARRQ